ncbi:MAG TPA: ABC transporter ATP-binding protein [Spirochaetia bacterium]|nr:ABC transporter ATP-binding protein [Spirochaetia bacterium]
MGGTPRDARPTEAEVVLEVEGLTTQFNAEYGLVRAVDGVSFLLHRGETLGIVGESGSGKSVTNLSILNLIQSPPGKITGGSVRFKGKDLTKSSEEELRLVRGGSISMIFQDPMTSLNPLLRVSTQISEAIRLHHRLKGAAARARTVEMLRAVGIPDAERRANDYPHQFSGGMRQRVMIAMALSCNPDILIADEPTTALDVTIQAQILDLVRNLSRDRNTAVILITHDLGVVAGMCDTVCIMYAGRIVERAPVDPLFASPKHPYTRALLDSIPRIDTDPRERLYSIPGQPPSLVGMGPGCPFAPRCDQAMEICRSDFPPETIFDGGREVRCWLHVDRTAAGARHE